MKSLQDEETHSCPSTEVGMSTGAGALETRGRALRDEAIKAWQPGHRAQVRERHPVLSGEVHPVAGRRAETRLDVSPLAMLVMQQKLDHKQPPPPQLCPSALLTVHSKEFALCPRSSDGDDFCARTQETSHSRNGHGTYGYHLREKN